MNGLNNFFTFVLNNWTMIGAVIAAVITCVMHFKNYYVALKNNDTEAAKNELQKSIDTGLECARISILSWVTEAESKYGPNTGSIKRSEVIAKVFTEFPVLYQVTDMDSLINNIDKMIDTSKETLVSVLSSNDKFKEAIYGTVATIKDAVDSTKESTSVESEDKDV